MPRNHLARSKKEFRELQDAFRYRKSNYINHSCRQCQFFRTFTHPNINTKSHKCARFSISPKYYSDIDPHCICDYFQISLLPSDIPIPFPSTESGKY